MTRPKWRYADLAHALFNRESDLLLRHQEERPAHVLLPYRRHLNDGLIELDGGAVMLGFSLGGCSFVTESSESITRFKEQRANAIQAAYGTNVSLYFHLVRREDKRYPKGESEDYFPRLINDLWRDLLDDDVLYANELYLCAVLWPKKVRGAGPLNSLKGLFQGKEQIRQRRKDALEQMLEDGETLADRLESTLKGFRPVRLGQYDKQGERYCSLLKHLNYLINLEEDEVRVPRAPLHHYLPQTRPLFGAEVIEMRSATDSRLCAMLSVKELPPETNPALLNNLLSAPVELILTQSFHFIATHETRELVKQQRRKINVNDDDGKRQGQLLDDLLDDLVDGLVCFGEFHQSIMLMTPWTDEPHAEKTQRYLKRLIEDISGRLAQVSIKAVRDTTNLQGAYLAQFPGNRKYIAIKQQLTSKNMASLASLHNFPSGRFDGNRWGPAVTAFPTTASTRYFFNFHAPGDFSPGSVIVVAQPGAGKTTFINFTVTLSRKYGVSVLHLGKDMSELVVTKAHRGKFGVLAKGVDSGMVPFQLPDSPRNRQFLAELFHYMLHPEGGYLTPSESEMIKLAIDTNYRMPPEERHLENLLICFGQSDHDGPRAQLKLWLDGQWAGLYSGKVNEFTLDSHYCTFDVTRVIKDETAFVAALLYLVHLMEEKAEAGKPHIILIEEGWRLAKHPFFVNRLEEWLLEIRRKNGLVVFITPDLHAACVDGAEVLAKATPTQIFLADPAGKAEDYCDVFGLTKEEFRLVKSFDLGDHQFLVRHEGQSQVCSFSFVGSELMKLVPIFSGSTARSHICEKVIEEFGDDPETWIPVYLERVKEAEQKMKVKN